MLGLSVKALKILMYLQESLHGGGGFSSMEWGAYSRSQDVYDSQEFFVSINKILIKPFGNSWGNSYISSL